MLLYGEGVLSSVSELAMLNGANSALIGDEIVQFMTATLVGAGKYELSGLLRGRLGTEDAIESHIAGERFVLLNNLLEKNETSNEYVGLERFYKAVTFGDTLANTESESFVYRAKSLLPYAPVHVKAVRDSSGNVTFSWVRRNRLHGQWRDYVDVPLSENSELYDIEIMDGETVVRSFLNVAATTSDYSAAEQNADFGSVQSNISVRIYQISDIVGRGKAASAVV